jgi:hypothetical protein
MINRANLVTQENEAKAICLICFIIDGNPSILVLSRASRFE